MGGQLARQGGEGLVREGPSGSAGPSLSPPPSPCPDPLLGFTLVPQELSPDSGDRKKGGLLAQDVDDSTSGSHEEPSRKDRRATVLRCGSPTASGSAVLLPGSIPWWPGGRRVPAD